MIDLYYYTSPNVRKVLIALEELGLSYEIKWTDISAGEQFDPQYLAINPNGKVPAIVDHDGPRRPADSPVRVRPPSCCTWPRRPGSCSRPIPSAGGRRSAGRSGRSPTTVRWPARQLTSSVMPPSTTSTTPTPPAVTSARSADSTRSWTSGCSAMTTWPGSSPSPTSPAFPWTRVAAGHGVDIKAEFPHVASWMRRISQRPSAKVRIERSPRGQGPQERLHRGAVPDPVPPGARHGESGHRRLHISLTPKEWTNEPHPRPVQRRGTQADHRRRRRRPRPARSRSSTRLPRRSSSRCPTPAPPSSTARPALRGGAGVAWRAVPLEQRQDYLRELVAVIRAHIDELGPAGDPRAGQAVGQGEGGDQLRTGLLRAVRVDGASGRGGPRRRSRAYRDPPGPGRRRRGDHRVELPAAAGAVEDRPRPGGRQSGNRQAVALHAGGHPAAGRTSPAGAAAGRAAGAVAAATSWAARSRPTRWSARSPLPAPNAPARRSWRPRRRR